MSMFECMLISDQLRLFYQMPCPGDTYPVMLDSTLCRLVPALRAC